MPIVMSTCPDRDEPSVRISSFCTGGGCVGVALEGDVVRLLDTKSGDGRAVRFSHESWTALTEDIRAGRLDLRRLTEP